MAVGMEWSLPGLASCSVVRHICVKALSLQWCNNISNMSLQLPKYKISIRKPSGDGNITIV